MNVFTYTCPRCGFKSAFLSEIEKEYLCADCNLIVGVKKRRAVRKPSAPTNGFQKQP